MALDFYVHVGCPMQNPWHPQALIREAKLRAMLEMLEANREQIELDQGRPLEELSVTLSYAVSGETREARAMTVAEMRQAWQQTEDKARPICPDCPANWRGRSVGCFAAISYPISEAGEQWLVDHFNPPLGERDELLREIMLEEITGEELDEQRPQAEDDPPGLLMAPAPARKRLASAGLEITSSQLLKGILSRQPSLNPRILLSLCASFGVVRFDPAELTALAARLEEQCPRPESGDDFFSGGVLKLISRDQDGRTRKLILGGSDDPAGEDEDDGDDEETAKRDEELLGNAALASIFEPRPQIKLPQTDSTWLKERLKDAPFMLQDEDGDERSISQIKRFLCAAWVALQEGALLVIDG